MHREPQTAQRLADAGRARKEVAGARTGSRATTAAIKRHQVRFEPMYLITSNDLTRPKRRPGLKFPAGSDLHGMSVLRTIESKLESLFEGVFGRAFRSNVQPVELARKLVKEMDDHRNVSVSRVYVPNEYTIYLAPVDASSSRTTRTSSARSSRTIWPSTPAASTTSF